MTLRKLFPLIVMLFLGSGQLYAADEDIPYGVRMPYRIVRGVVNIGLGWTEILLRPFGEIKTEGFFGAVPKAAYDTLTRSSAGFQDIFMFWVPDMQMENVYPDWEVWPYLFHWS